MSERDKSFSGSKFGKGSNIGFSSGPMSKQLVQNHVKSIMPSLRGGKKQDDVKYLRIRVQQNLNSQKQLEPQMKQILNDFCGEYYDYKLFKSTDQLLEEDITENDLFYIFLKEEDAKWGQRFARQELNESKGKKSIFIVQFLRKMKYKQKVQERQRLVQKNRRDPNDKIIYFINADDNYMQEIQNNIIPDMDSKLKNKLLREGDRIKTWALAAKSKQKVAKKERLYIYIEEMLKDKLQKLYRHARKKNGFKWTQIIKFSSFKDILQSVKKRQQQFSNEGGPLTSQLSIHPVSKILDRSQSAIKSLSYINGGASILSTNKSVKNVILQKTEHRLRTEDKNFIIHSYDFEQGQKIYQYVMSQKDNNWQRVIYEQKNFPHMDNLVKQIEDNQKQNQNDQYLKIINAQTLYIITYDEDIETNDISNRYPNNFNNRYILGYQDEVQLLNLLQSYARNDDNFTIVIIRQPGSLDDQTVSNFLEKNKNISDFQNLVIKYKRGYDLSSSLSMNSKVSLNDQNSLDKYLAAVMEDRDRNFDPFNCYDDSYVYILIRIDKQYLLDQELRRKIGQSARLKKATYQDGNYLQNFIKGLERSGYHSIILTDDKGLRQAQQAAKKFEKTKIMNVTDRKKVKDQIKVICWGPLKTVKQAIFSISDKLRIEERKQYTNLNKQEIWLANPNFRKAPAHIQFKQGNNITVKISSQETSKDSGIMQDNLNYYFKQQIRIQNYNEPKEVRLSNKVEQPLTFIICRDIPEELEYMKKVAKQEKQNISQEYIIYTQNPNKHLDIYNNEKYERFRFISNSWRRIQDYIIGRYQDLTGVKKEKIYSDEIIHIFIHPNDTHLKKIFDQRMNSNQEIWKNIRFHDVRNLQWVALEQSPHHVYYVLVDETSNNFPATSAYKQIQKAQSIIAARGVAPKNLKMIIINKKSGVMADPYIKGSFQTPQKAIDYIASTQLKRPNYEATQPHIIINRNQNNWYYFLNKNRHLNYQLHQIDKMQDVLKLIEGVRNKNAGSAFWYLTDNPKDLSQFFKTANLIEQGRETYGILNYQYPLPGINLPENRIVMASPQRQQIQAFILDIFKRRPYIFPPQSLRSRNPIIAITQESRSRIPIDENQIKRWREDLGADYRILGRVNDVANFPQDKNVIWISHIDEQKALKDLKLNSPNVWKIVFDSNQENREKAHKLYKIFPDTHQVYNGYYPAEITNCLTYWRYNMKNSPQKLSSTYKKPLTNIFLQKELQTNQKIIDSLQKHNHSISNIFSFQSNPQEIQNAINYVLSMPEYDNLFVLSNNSEQILNQNPNKSKINYILFDTNRAGLLSRYGRSDAKLLTDEQPQYITYMYNLPETRYEPAKNMVSKNPLKLMYLNNGKYEAQVQQLKEIMRRNPNFGIYPYQNISDLSQVKQNIIVLTDAADYQKHMNELKYVQNIKYFVLGQDKTRNLIPDKQKSEIFVTKDYKQLNGFFNNLRRTTQNMKPIAIPRILSNPDSNKNKITSRPLVFKNGLNVNKLTMYPPFNLNVPNFNQINFLDPPRQDIFNFPQQLRSDGDIRPENIQTYSQFMPLKLQRVQAAPKAKNVPHKLILDQPIRLNKQDFKSKPDNQSSWANIYQKIKQPSPRVKNLRLAIVYPDSRQDSKQFNNIYRVLNSNLAPKAFESVTPFTYNSDYEFQNLYRELAKKQCKFSPFDKTVIFLKPQMGHKYDRQLKQLIKMANRNNIKAQYFYFDDNFDQRYDHFRDFLQPYQIKNQQLPYINKEDPNYWLTTSLYNVMVPLNKKKRYDVIKRNNIIVLPYTSEQDIQNQLHRNQQFVIIVCEKKDYHRFKKFPRMSPRCILVIDDKEQLKQDEIPLFRYPKKVLYFGNDALNYLQKIRIPNKCLPYKNQAMKVLFYNQNHPQEIQFADLSEFDQYQKVPYRDSQDLFIKLIQKFKTSSNFKVPSSLVAKGLIKLHPKRYSERKTSYMDNYFSKYSVLEKQVVIEDQYNKSFKSIIKPHQYAHLPLKEYDNPKQLRQFLELQQSPCLVYIDQDNKQHKKMSVDFRKRHLFIMMYDLVDIWINQKGYLIPAEKLKRQNLALKQTMMADMFNPKVFDTYNDMAYFYLSNTAEKYQVRGARNITFMTKQGLIKHFNDPKEHNTLIVLFVEDPDKQHIPKQFYDPYTGRSCEDRVKIIFIHRDFVHNEDLFYIKTNEIDPVIKHINRVQISSREDFCIFPGNSAGRIKWHQFTSKHKGFLPYEYSSVNQMDEIASMIKGKYRNIYVICQREDESFIRTVFEGYAIRTKPGAGQKVTFWHISDLQNQSYMIMPLSNIRPSNLAIPDPLQDNDQKFETAGQQIDIKINSKNKNYENDLKQIMSSSNYLSSKNQSHNNKANNNMNLQDLIQSKDFVINLNQKLRDTFPVGNLYASKIKYFKNLDNLQLNNDLNQLLITNQNYNKIKNELENNPNLFLVYVSDQIPSGRQGKSFVIKQNDIPKFIGDLEGIQSGKKHISDYNQPKYQKQIKLNSQNHSFQPEQDDRKIRTPVSPANKLILQNSNNVNNLNNMNNLNNVNNVENGSNPQNIQDFKVVRIFYDEGLDVQIKKQIFYAALKNKNFSPYLLKDMSMLKSLMKQQGALSLLLISKDPPNLKQQLQKQNFTIIRSKKGKVIVPKYFSPSIDGLSTILQQDQSQFQNIDKQNLADEVDAFLKMMQSNPQKGRALILATNYESDKTSNKNQQAMFGKDNTDLAQQDSDKLNLHSNINIEGNTQLGSRQFIKTRLDGGVIVVFVDKNSADKLSELKRKLNILVQQYSHSINLNNSIRQKKDKFTIVLVEPNMLPQVKTIKQQYPKTVFVLVNPDKRQIAEKDRQNIAYTISSIEQFEPIIQEIYEQNQKFKYPENGKIQSRMDNKKTSYVDNGNSWRFSTGYQNTRVKNAFVFYKQEKNKELKKKLQYLNHITFVPYKDFTDAQKKFNSYSGYQVVLIANDQDIPLFEDYVLKKKEQAYLIKLNQPDDYRQNPKIKKNILLSAFSDEEIANYLILKFGQNISTTDRNQQKPKQGKSYAPRYQPNTFGTTPRFPSQKDYVPYKNDPIYSSRGIKSLSRESKVLKSDANSNRDISPRYAQSPSPYYNH